MILFKIGFVFLVVIVVFHLLTRKYLNPYKLTMVFGKKGSGKTTLMIKIAQQYIKRGWSVYSTEPIPGCYQLDYKDIGHKMIPPNSLLLVDEVGMVWDNRNYKTFDPKVRDWFKLQRHYRVKCVLFSQTFDIDKKLRDLTDDMYLCTNLFRVFSWAKRIRRTICLVEPSGDSPARIDEALKFDCLLFWPWGARICTFIPKYAPYFDSHACPILDPGSWIYHEPLKKPKRWNLWKSSERSKK